MHAIVSVKLNLLICYMLVVWSTESVNVFICLYTLNKLYITARVWLQMLTNAFSSLLSDPALHHFSGATSTERHRQRAECSPSATVTQRASSGSILWHPLWRRACICWLVKPDVYFQRRLSYSERRKCDLESVLRVRQLLEITQYKLI